MKEELLSEERYQSSKKKITILALTILIVGVMLGGLLITIGIIKQHKVNLKYSVPFQESLAEQIEIEKQNLYTEKTSIEEKIKPIEDEIKRLQRVKFEGFDDAYYERQDKIEELVKSILSERKQLSIIDGALNDADFACKFEAKSNRVTSKYCSLVNDLVRSSDGFNKSFDSSSNYAYYIIGGFIIFTSLMISASVYSVAKRREIMAFNAQQMMPLAEEGLEKISPSVGKAGAKIAEQMAPVYGSVAKSIAKGVKEGLKEEKPKKKKTNKK